MLVTLYKGRDVRSRRELQHINELSVTAVNVEGEPGIMKERHIPGDNDGIPMTVDLEEEVEEKLCPFPHLHLVTGKPKVKADIEEELPVGRTEHIGFRAMEGVEYIL